MKKIIIFILASVILSVAGQLALKMGVSKLGSKPSAGFLLMNMYKQPLIIGGLSLYALSAVIWIYVLSKTDLSFAYPFLALNFVGIMFVSWMFLNEAINLPRIIGSMVIVVGVLIISRGAS